MFRKAIAFGLSRWSCAAVKVFDDAATPKLRVAFDFDGGIAKREAEAVSRKQ